MLSYLNRLKISNKLSLLAGVLIAGLVLYGFISYIVLTRLKIKGVYYEKLIEGKDLIADILPPPAYIIESYLLSFQEADETNPAALEELLKRSDQLYKDFEKRYQFWSKNIVEEDLKQAFLVDAYHFGEEFFTVWHRQFLPALQSGNKEEAHALLQGPLKQLYNQHRQAVDKTLVLVDEHNKAIEKEVDEVYNFGQNLSLLAWILTILIGSLLAYLITRSINKQLSDTLKGLGSVSTEIDSRMVSQAQSIAQQSASVHETTSTMDELSTSFLHTESLAQESSKRAKSALQVSEEGNTLIKQMLEGLLDHKDKVSGIVERILKLSDITNQIHNVASTINNLTNQTNILALNAAVQAAHVKQNGEGFSVIASEIRKLADESKKFLSHIDLLAENIKHATDATVVIAQEGNKTVQDSIKLAQSSAHAFESIISITTNSFEGAEQVLLNVRQQSNAVHQVLEAMEVLNETAHQNLTGMNQVRTELEKLNSLSSSIQTII